MIVYLMIASVILLALYAEMLFKQRSVNNRLPQGPSGWPFVGNMLQIGKEPYMTLSKWAREYGKLYTIDLAGKPALVVNDHRLMRNLFAGLASTGKFKSDIMVMFTNGNYGVANAEGEIWKEQKQFCIQTLRKFGAGNRSRMQHIILQEANEFCSWISKQIVTSGNIRAERKLKRAVGNIIWTMVTDITTESEKKQLGDLINEGFDSLQYATNSGLLFFPWIRHFVPVLSGYRQIEHVISKIHKILEKCIQEHEKTFVSEAAPRDLIDSYIQKIQACSDPKSSFYGEVGKKNCLGTVVALISAAGDTAGSSINWMIFHLTVYQDVQRKLQEEIDNVIGRENEPCFFHKAKMPYMEAVLLETLRFASLTPFGVPHELLENTDFCGFHLPKGMLLFANLYYAHYDKSIWGDPEVFRPERFLEGGCHYKDFVVPFQVGKRSCIAEAQAKDIMFLFAARIFQRFAFSPDLKNNRLEMYLEPMSGFLLLPKKLAVICKHRR